MRRRRRRRRSGNGTNAAQDLYVMVNIPFVWIWKVGISKDAKQRAADLSLETPGVWVPVAWVRMWFAYTHEQWLLSVTSWAHVPFRGLTETRFVIPGVILWAWVLILVIFKYAAPIAAIYLLTRNAVQS